MKLERDLKTQDCNLYVKNYDETIITSDEKLEELFKPFGKITSCKIMRDEVGKSKGFAFVCFEEKDLASKAIKELNSKMINNKPLFVCIAQKKDERSSQLAAKNAQYQQFRYHPNQAMHMGYSHMMQNQIFLQGNNQLLSHQRANPQMAYQMQQQMLNQRSGWGNSQVHNQQLFPQQINLNRPAMGINAVNLSQQQPISDLRMSLNMMSEQQRKQFIGEAIFTRLYAANGNRTETASKITGMLLEMDNETLIHLIENPDALHMKEKEALDELKKIVP